jgi:hypothetical protein
MVDNIMMKSTATGNEDRWPLTAVDCTIALDNADKVFWGDKVFGGGGGRDGDMQDTMMTFKDARYGSWKKKKKPCCVYPPPDVRWSPVGKNEHGYCRSSRTSHRQHYNGECIVQRRRFFRSYIG